MFFQLDLRSLADQGSLAVLGLFLLLFVYFAFQGRRGATPLLRSIPAYQAFQDLLARAAEAGLPVHISVGTAGVGQASTADTTAGMYALEFLAERAAVSAIPPIVTVGDATALPLAQDQLRRAYDRQGYPEEYDPRQVRWVAPSVQGSAVPYAVGVMDILSHERATANVMVGSFGDEFLLMSEPGAQRNLVQIGGASQPQVLPFVYTSTSFPLLGEEIYAAAAYLNARRAHLASLLAQDTMRVLLVAFVILAVIARSIGLV